MRDFATKNVGRVTNGLKGTATSYTQNLKLTQDKSYVTLRTGVNYALNNNTLLQASIKYNLDRKRKNLNVMLGLSYAFK